LQVAPLHERHAQTQDLRPLFRFLHTADWQIGARFLSFGEFATQLRAARIRTLERALMYSQEEQIGLFLIAGDLFEDHQIDVTAVLDVYNLLSRFDGLTIVITPGNHDPIGMPGTIWDRPPFQTLPPHIRLVRTSQAIELEECFLIPNPTRQKKSSTDPSALLLEHARSLPHTKPRIGIAHGSPAIDSKHQHDDFPIQLETAMATDLDYVALGHWHRYQVFSGGRMVMPGTPEPTAYGEKGSVVCVELEPSRGSVTSHAVDLAEFAWREFIFDLDVQTSDVILSTIQKCMASDRRHVVSVLLTGHADAATVDTIKEQLSQQRSENNWLEIRDQVSGNFAETEKLSRESPILAAVLDKLDSVESLKATAKEIGIPEDLLEDPEFFEMTRRILQGAVERK
jgi:DNA repair exonuclease SbcCD nuclease subunit